MNSELNLEIKSKKKVFKGSFIWGTIGLFLFIVLGGITFCPWYLWIFVALLALVTLSGLHKKFQIGLSIFVILFCTPLLIGSGESGSSSKSIVSKVSNTKENNFKRKSQEPLNLNYPAQVTAYLSHQSFTDDKGNTISFDGSASGVKFNGRYIGATINVIDIGREKDGSSYATFTFSHPATGKWVMTLTEGYGLVYIFSYDDPQTIYYKK